MLDPQPGLVSVMGSETCLLVFKEFSSALSLHTPSLPGLPPSSLDRVYHLHLISLSVSLLWAEEGNLRDSHLGGCWNIQVYASWPTQLVPLNRSLLCPL